MTQCNAGHMFDEKQHFSCPFCGVPGLDFGTQGARANPSPLRPSDDEARGRDAGGSRAADGRSGMSEGSGGSVSSDHVRTRSHETFDPVVGWFVCVEGTSRGRDFRIRSGQNSLGRDRSMDICVPDDETVSREAHAYVIYDPLNREFKLLAGLAAGLTFHNGKTVTDPVDLKLNDEVVVGKTRLRFVPFCGDAFHWEE